MRNIKKKLVGARRSKTVLFNSIMAVLLPSIIYAQEMLPILKELLTPEAYQATGLAVVIINIVLRFKTDNSLDNKHDQ
jgi:hypothetical protein